MPPLDHLGRLIQIISAEDLVPEASKGTRVTTAERSIPATCLEGGTSPTALAGAHSVAGTRAGARVVLRRLKPAISAEAGVIFAVAVTSAVAMGADTEEAMEAVVTEAAVAITEI